MQHRKQAMENIESIIKWNKDRGLLDKGFDKLLEYKMLLEEVEELKEAKTEIDIVDALQDILFISYGSLAKLGLTAEDIVDCLTIVYEANDKKGSNTNADGKIIKDEKFQGPETKLQSILDRRLKKSELKNI